MSLHRCGARLVPLVLLVGLVACGDDRVEPVTTSSAPVVLLEHDATGGCLVLGPNCPRYVVYSDGTVELFRHGVTGPAEATARVPMDAIEAWVAQVGATDLDALVARLPPGTCASCVDGADITLTLHTPNGLRTLDSTVVEFDPGEPLFAELDRLMAAVTAVAQLEIVER